MRRFHDGSLCAFLGDAVRYVCLSLLIIGASVGSSAAQSTAPVHAGPIKTQAECPFAAKYRVPMASVPSAKLRVYLACVAKYNSDMAAAQAVSWIEDWHKAASCVYYCDAAGINSLAHVSLWRGLRYIIVQSLPQEEAVDAGCRKAQLSIAVALDEGVNDLSGYRRHISEAEFCKTRRAQDLREESYRRIDADWKRIYGQIEAFQHSNR